MKTCKITFFFLLFCQFTLLAQYDPFLYVLVIGTAPGGEDTVTVGFDGSAKDGLDPFSSYFNYEEIDISDSALVAPIDMRIQHRDTSSYDCSHRYDHATGGYIPVYQNTEPFDSKMNIRDITNTGGGPRITFEIKPNTDTLQQITLRSVAMVDDYANLEDIIEQVHYYPDTCSNTPVIIPFYGIPIGEEYTITFDTTIYSFEIKFIQALFSNTKEVSSSKIAQLQPNPASDFATLSFAQPINGNLRIYNLYGRLQEKTVIQKEDVLSLDLSQYSKGIYLIELTSRDGNYRQLIRFIKE